MVLVLDDLLKLPFDIGVEVLQGIAEKAESEGLTSEKAVRDRVLRTQMNYERGDLSEAEYQASIAVLRSRLKELKGE